MIIAYNTVFATDIFIPFRTYPCQLHRSGIPNPQEYFQRRFPEQYHCQDPQGQDHKHSHKLYMHTYPYSIFSIQINIIISGWIHFLYYPGVKAIKHKSQNSLFFLPPNKTNIPITINTTGMIYCLTFGVKISLSENEKKKINESPVSIPTGTSNPFSRLPNA